MNQIATKIGQAVVNFFTSIHTDNLLDALFIMGIGMLGIFLVTGVIIAVITLLCKLFAAK